MWARWEVMSRSEAEEVEEGVEIREAASLASSSSERGWDPAWGTGWKDWAIASSLRGLVLCCAGRKLNRTVKGLEVPEV